MAERLEDLLRSCTVRVLGGSAPGAGFFVAPGQVLTCAHVTGEGTHHQARHDIATRQRDYAIAKQRMDALAAD